MNVILVNMRMNVVLLYYILCDILDREVFKECEIEKIEVDKGDL